MARQRSINNTLTIYVMRQPIPSRRGVAEGRGVSHQPIKKTKAGVCRIVRSDSEAVNKTKARVCRTIR